MFPGQKSYETNMKLPQNANGSSREKDPSSEKTILLTSIVFVFYFSPSQRSAWNFSERACSGGDAKVFRPAQTPLRGQSASVNHNILMNNFIVC